MRAFLTLLGVCAMVAGLLMGPVKAHTNRAAITTVLFNPRTNNLEVMHRFHLHDAEHAVREIFGKDADILGSEETRNDFSAYVADRFHLSRGDTNAEIPLTFVGHLVEGKFIWVYQEAPNPGVSALVIAHNALRDLWPDQQNTVNVEGAFGVKSAHFEGAVELARIELAP